MIAPTASLQRLALSTWNPDDLAGLESVPTYIIDVTATVHRV